LIRRRGVMVFEGASPLQASLFRGRQFLEERSPSILNS